jgi:hypothetical protein
LPIITFADDEIDVKTQCSRYTIKSNEAEIKIFEARTTMDMYFKMAEVLDLRRKLLTLQAEIEIADGNFKEIYNIASAIEFNTKDIVDLNNKYIGLQARDEVWSSDKILFAEKLAEFKCWVIDLEDADFEVACDKFPEELGTTFNCRAIATAKKLEVEKKNGPDKVHPST